RPLPEPRNLRSGSSQIKVAQSRKVRKVFSTRDNTVMYQQDLEMLRLTRAETLRLTAGVDQAQSEFAPAAEKWSVGEVLDHLLLAENYYRAIFGRLIELQKSGAPAVISASFSEVNTSIAFLPKSMLPMAEVPFT